MAFIKNWNISGRPLKPGEVALARSVFRNKIDYSKVRIGVAPDFLKANITPGNTMYMLRDELRDDYSAVGADQGLFIHELTHVWQHQSGRCVVAEAAWEWVKHKGEYSNAYLFSEEHEGDGKTFNVDFKKLNLEQQAGLLENYYNYRNDPEVRKRVDPVMQKAGFSLPPPLPSKVIQHSTKSALQGPGS